VGPAGAKLSAALAYTPSSHARSSARVVTLPRIVEPANTKFTGAELRRCCTCTVIRARRPLQHLVWRLGDERASASEGRVELAAHLVCFIEAHPE
jgi:hypothetical protein